MKHNLAALAFLLLVSCAKNEVVVHVTNPTDNGPKIVRLQAVNDNIIRVTSTAEDQLRDRKSLITLNSQLSNRTATLNYKLSTLNYKGDTVALSTAGMTAYVLRTTGQVWVEDKDGKRLLQESAGSPRFTPYECTQPLPLNSKLSTTLNSKLSTLNYTGWTYAVAFDNLFPEEGLFGLGQHQADEWNWKGRDEELYQYNTKVSLPIIFSTEGYGLMFDTYSLARFGNPLPYAALEDLFEVDTIATRVDDKTIVYEGTLTPHETGEYRFLHYYSGYQQLFIDGQPMSDVIWRTAWNPNERKYRYYMEAGRPYKIRLTWQPDGDVAYCSLTAHAPESEETHQQLRFWSEMNPNLDYYVFAGENIDSLIHEYRTLTGKASQMPDWVLGYWQSRERYKTQDEIIDALRGFKERNLPIDNIVMDWNYWEPSQWGAFTFEESRFPNPQAMIDTIHALGAHIMISCWPKYYPFTDHYQEMLANGYLYPQSIRDSLIDWLGFPYAFYDAYNPKAGRLFFEQLWEHLGTMGIDAWWMDASEPNVKDCTPFDYRKALCGPTYLGSSDEYFNAYALVNAQSIYEGLQRKGVKDIFQLTRSGFVGLQRYATATWSGDIGTRWEDMKAQITAGLNYSVSGLPWWSQDIGGFSVENRYAAAQHAFDATGKENADLKEWRELNVRWHQWGVFTPIYRSHGQFPYREPWNIAPEGHPAYEVIKSCLEERYKLMPYLQEMNRRVYEEDYTIMRPLAMDYPNDPKAVNCGWQYMFGPDIMVCPVYTYGAREWSVYFPEGMWYDYYTGQLVSKGNETLLVPAPYDHSPIFLRNKKQL
ncbi:MAG: DUF4968 domain-containing protein [Paludibacteraceae bacterium]|nr:DUF4968 domain-containing protein [Paludibacteraceae bacterium]